MSGVITDKERTKWVKIHPTLIKAFDTAKDYLGERLTVGEFVRRSRRVIDEVIEREVNKVATAPALAKAPPAARGPRPVSHKRFNSVSHEMHKELIHAFLTEFPADTAGPVIFAEHGLPQTAEDKASFLWTAQVYAENPQTGVRGNAPPRSSAHNKAVYDYLKWVRKALEWASKGGLEIQ